jgi:peptide/nickel transport system substrate-binding protein
MPNTLTTIKLSRRKALGLLSAGLGTAIVSACTPTAPAPSPTVSVGPSVGITPGAAGGTPAPRTGGTLRYGSPMDQNRLDPHFRLGDVYYTVYDRLTRYDSNHTVQPMLAESWDVAPDWTSIRFTLRKGVRFHNGVELDSAAVKFNSERARDLPNTQLDEAKWWTSIETPDKYTVIFRSDRSRPLAFDYFEFLNIAEPTSVNDPMKAIGTGPFKLVEWKPGESLTLTKNTSYWQSGRPYLDGIVMSVITDSQAMTTRLEAGALDVAVVPVTDFLRLRDQPAYAPFAFAAGEFQCLGVNCQDPPWNDKKLRQALLYAADRGRWATTIQRGLEVPSALPWPRGSPAYDEARANAFPFDLEKAAALLKAAGYSGGYTGDLLVQNSNAELAAFAQVLQSDFARLGITLAIKALEQAAYLDLTNNGRYRGFFLGGGTFTLLDPATAFTKSRVLSPNGNSSAFAAPANEAAVGLVNRATTETDPLRRQQLYADLNEMLLDEAYIICLSPLTSRLMATNKVHGIAPTLHSGGGTAAKQWWEAWLA